MRDRHPQMSADDLRQMNVTVFKYIVLLERNRLLMQVQSRI